MFQRRKEALKNLDADIRDHIDRETTENLDRGMTRQEARALALRKFGNSALVMEDTRAVWSTIWRGRDPGAGNRHEYGGIFGGAYRFLPAAALRDIILVNGSDALTSSVLTCKSALTYTGACSKPTTARGCRARTGVINSSKPR
jgi:hypothetical protein